MMYQALLLSDSDVAALRAALQNPQFASLVSKVPGLPLALQQPQEDFDYSVLCDLYDVISQARSNTNYPEDWDNVTEAVDKALCRRRVFDEAAELPPPVVPVADVAPQSQCRFIVVIENIGAADGPRFGKHVYDDFKQACAALHAEIKNSVEANHWTYREVQRGEPDPGMDWDTYGMNGYICGNPEEQTYWVYLGSSWNSPNYCYSLQKFEVAPAEMAHVS